MFELLYYPFIIICYLLQAFFFILAGYCLPHGKTPTPKEIHIFFFSTMLAVFLSICFLVGLSLV